MFEQDNSPSQIPSGMHSEHQAHSQAPSPYEAPKMIESPKRMKIDKNTIIVGIAILGIIITAILIFTNIGSNFSMMGFGKSKEAIANSAIDYLNKNLLQAGQTATLGTVAQESGIIKFQVKIGSSSYDSYITKDGRFFFPQAYELKPSDSVNNSGGKTGETVSFDITSENHIRGNVSAPITLVEFSDFECPYCEKHTPTLDKIILDYKDKVRLVYKHYPLTNIHPNAQKAAEASECASEQGKFWEYHDILFKNQKSGLSVDKFKTWAAQLGLNVSQFNSCLDSSKYKSKVDADLAEGSSKGVSGTPGTFINGELVEGAVPYETFKQKIDALLSK